MFVFFIAIYLVELQTFKVKTFAYLLFLKRIGPGSLTPEWVLLFKPNPPCDLAKGN